MSIDLAENFAILVDARIVVRARFIEAVDTIERMEVRNLWPASDRTVWPAIAVERGMGKASVRHRPTNAAISRAEEVMQAWLLDYVRSEHDRLVVLRWAGSVAARKTMGSFADFCREKRLVRRTAERAVSHVFASIASGLLKNSRSLHEPDWWRVSQLDPKSRREFDMVARRAAEHGPTYWRAKDAVPTHQAG